LTTSVYFVIASRMRAIRCGAAEGLVTNVSHMRSEITEESHHEIAKLNNYHHIEQSAGEGFAAN
jgi:hypothetical protein